MLSATTNPELTTRIIEVLEQHGLTLVGSTHLSPLEEDHKRLQEWLKQGHAASQHYLERSKDLRHKPQDLLWEELWHKSAYECSAIVVGVPYAAEPVRPLPPAHGRVARYAAGRDYHRVLKKLLTKALKEIESSLGRKLIAKIAVDSTPLLEKALAQRAGLGFIGKNTLLIRPGLGSFFLLAEIIWELPPLELPFLPSSKTVGCRSCTRCLTGCPTGAFVSPFQLDSRRCISYLTIEQRGPFSPAERLMLGEWIFGCDICQEVCPFNHSRLNRDGQAALKELSAAAGSGTIIGLKELLEIRKDAQFLERFAGTPLMRPKREGLLRNTCCVAANTRSYELAPLLASTAQTDPSDLVRSTALWALAQLDTENQQFGEFKELGAIQGSNSGEKGCTSTRKADKLPQLTDSEAPAVIQQAELKPPSSSTKRLAEKLLADHSELVRTEALQLLGR